MKKFLSLFLALVLLMSTCISASAAFRKKNMTLRLVVPENWEMDIGDSRSVEAVFSASVSKRTLTWSAEPSTVATVDSWGRVTAVSKGTAKITAGNPDGLSDTVTLKVVETPTEKKITKSRQDYAGAAVSEGTNLQKVVTRYKNGRKKAPDYIKNSLDYQNAQQAVTKDGAT